jgi:PilZ domain-containing protein
MGHKMRANIALETDERYIDDWTVRPRPVEWPLPPSTVRPAAVAKLEPAASRRLHTRVYGPFDGIRIGALETPVQLYDLSRGGCFINSMHHQQPGIKLLLKIDLPQERWITVNAETLPRSNEFGYAVQFVKMSDEAAERLERFLQAPREGLDAQH